MSIRKFYLSPNPYGNNWRNVSNVIDVKSTYNPILKGGTIINLGSIPLQNINDFRVRVINITAHGIPSMFYSFKLNNNAKFDLVDSVILMREFQTMLEISLQCRLTKLPELLNNNFQIHLLF